MSDEESNPYDPTVLIQPPFIVCPHCGADVFGVAFIQGHYFFRRCRECWHSQQYRLPPIQKKIVYLDQFAISRKAASGMRRPPSRGMSNDIETISTLLPYCDAMFIDDECRTYLSEQPLVRELDFGTRLFSQSNKQEFLDYLQEIHTSMSEEHRHVIQGVYGEDWATPYTNLYQSE